MMRTVGSLLGLVLLAGCHAEASRAEASRAAASPDRRSWKPATEFGPLRLGMSLDAAIAALPEAKWNGTAAQECISDLALKGCFLTQYQSPFAYRLDGIPFSPTLSFNKHGVLTDFDLIYDPEASGDPSVKREQCRSVYARMIDVVAHDYGPMAFETKPEIKGDYPMTVLTTAAGIKYPFGADPKDPFFVAGPVRNNFDGVRFPTSASIVTWNELPYVQLFGTFIVVDRKPACRIDIGFSLPASVERRTE